MDDSIKNMRSVLTSHQFMLRERLQDFLAQVKQPLHEDVVRALEEPGKLLMTSSSEAPPAGLWSLVTILVAQSVQPTIDLHIASSVAVSVECFICALDLLDDIEDGDQTQIVNDLGSARVLNISTALLMLAQRAITSLATYIGDPALIVKLLKVFEDATFLATTGQHQDLLAESETI